jgi:hypothetical protein
MHELLILLISGFWIKKDPVVQWVTLGEAYYQAA